MSENTLTEDVSAAIITESRHLIPARGVDHGAVVRTEDGFLGWLWKGHGHALCVVGTDVQRDLPAGAVVEVVKWPAELAGEWLRRTK